MDIVIIILLAFVVLLLGLVFYQNTHKREKPSDGLSMLLQQMNELSSVVDKKMGETSKQVNEAILTQSQDARRLIQDINKQVSENLINVTKSVTEVGETGKQVLTITDQLRNLEKVLKHQKQRGNLGEASLELILSNILPPTSYKMQYSFADGDTVDAIIETKEGFIPVDAKFSLDNYNRITNEDNEERRKELEKDFRNDLKKRIDETSKYIKTKEGTLPFAFMFIPAEGIYYDLLINEVGSVKVNTRNLLDYAYNDKKVVIVSPTTFAAYLQSVLYGFNAYRIEKSAEKIKKNVEQLGKHISAYDQFMGSLGKSLGTTVNHYNKAHKELKKIDKDVVKIAEVSPGIEPLELAKPVDPDE